ncbi:PREDICTED: wall-associated receptor kinase 2-like [Prunus mume]|uniref:Wall-associated receptor kinase 2-like n=1 Tax=Prunus mume TaxID=102107 RepID=A0ABM1LMG5_PRUMU|nr:PREDICTED: wall-associated receptor kinase 2-like [Prunus mume]
MPIPHMAFQYGMLMQLSIKLLVVLVATTRASAGGAGEENETAIALPDCKPKCGNVTIPYPFGIGARCYFGPRFEITCEDRSTEPRLMKSRMLVSNISLEEGELQTMQLVNRVCFDSQGDQTGTEDQSVGGLTVIPPYTISGAKNMLVAVGCDTYVRLVGSRDDQNYTTGCFSQCQNNISSNAIDKNDPCSGMGCCETKIPPLMHNLSLTVLSFRQHEPVWDFNPCSYAFVVGRGNFTFSNTSFQQLRNTTRLPLVLDWKIGDESCENAKKSNNYACKGNSDCHNTTSSGYICRCKDGYKGNPYLEDSCQDIDECALNATLCENGKCINKVGNYTCECNSGYHNLDDITCIKAPNTKPLKISLGVSLSFSVLVVAILWKYRKSRKKKEEYLRRKYFEENGGERLKEKLGDKARIFTESEIKEATNNYAVRNEIGRGTHGIVYRGVLDRKDVAIRKSRVSAPTDHQNQSNSAPTDQNQNTEAPTDQKEITPQEQFVNEMTVLYQINHNNVVRFVGCCLETKPPILVYKFIRNGSLHTRIHGKEGEKPPPPLPLATRLNIAAETAGALAYLHHDGSNKIIHGDVKTANILLDENLTPKLSDFGASRLLVPEDENQKSTLVHDSDGYVDPEYLDSKSKKPLTEKSDVYSFGVVLAELLTGRKAEENLAKDFVDSVEKDTLGQILDGKIVEEHLDEEVRKAADLAKRCLKSSGEERPFMRQVAPELQLLVLTMALRPSG